jgi:hypothetical protein
MFWWLQKSQYTWWVRDRAICAIYAMLHDVATFFFSDVYASCAASLRICDITSFFSISLKDYLIYFEIKFSVRKRFGMTC